VTVINIHLTAPGFYKEFFMILCHEPAVFIRFV